MSENKGVKSECKKFGDNSGQVASVSTICDEYCSLRYSWPVTHPLNHLCRLYKRFRVSTMQAAPVVTVFQIIKIESSLILLVIDSINRFFVFQQRDFRDNNFVR